MAKSSYGTTGLGLFNQDRKQLKQLNTINMKNERQVLFFDKTESSHDHLSIMMPRTSPHAQEDQNSYSHTISIKDHCKTARGHLQKIGGSSHLGYNPSNSQMTKSMSLKNKLKQIDGSCSQFVAQVGAMSTMPSVRNSTNNSQNKNLGKQFVLVKGKAQHCEKYILNDLQPYSQIQTNSKTTTASSKIRNPNRKSLMLQQMNSKNQQSMNPQYQNSHKKGKARGNKIRRKTTKGRKGSNSIMEEEGEHSSQDETTWQDFRNQNQELKDQILNQIAIFQQYLKVAVLQHKSQQAEEERYQKRSPQFSKRHVSVDNHVLVTNRDFQFDVKGEIQSSGGAKEMQMALDRQNVRTGVVPIQRMRKMQSGMNRGLPPISDNQYMTNQNKDKFLSLTRHASVETLRCSGSADNNSKNSRSILKAQKKIQNKASVKSFDTSSAIGITASEYQQTFQINNSTIGRKSQKMKALRYLIPHSQLNDSAQAQWVQKIKKLWKKLNKHENDEVSKLEDEIKENKAHIKKLSLNNLYELDTNANDQKILTKVQGKKKKVDKNLKSNSDVKKIRKLQDRVRKELQRKVEFNTWGFHNYIISYRIKCRLTEDVIDCAQRVSIKSDEKTQRELSILKQLRDRTDEDLRIFVERREKQPWRLWDRYHVFGYGHDFKPSLQNHEITFIELTEQIDNDLKSISYLETSYSQLRLDIPYYNQINCEMIKFITDVFGNAGWLQLFSLKLLRKQQEDEQHVKQYMPPVDQIKMFEVDPYTLQVEASSADNQIRQTNIQIVPVKKLSGYELRKPDQPTQNTLKTGYEPRITTINENNKLNSSAAPASETVLVHDNNVTPEQDQAIKSEEEKKKSTWLETLKKEGIEKEVREQKEKKARAARLAVLFQAEEVLNEKDVWDINNEENDHEILDLCAAKGRISSYMDKIDTHLQVEKRLLEAWQHIDSQDQKVEKKIVPASVEAQGPLE